MDKLKSLSKIKDIYQQGGNVIEYLKSIGNSMSNTTEDIMISYDFQAGSYIKYAEQKTEYINSYTKCIANVIAKLGQFSSILEAGVGEATTLGNLICNTTHMYNNAYGFDLSWSRIKYAKHYLSKLNINNVTLVTGDLFASPFKSNSIDIVYTSHSIEPNGGKEREAVKELYRITKRYLILLEPSFEFATDEGRYRMLKNGYITNLFNTVIELGYKVVEHRLFDMYANPLNPTGLIVIEKLSNADEPTNALACPITNTPLQLVGNAYYSKEAFLAYPIIDEIPCLVAQNAIIATHLLTKI